MSDPLDKMAENARELGLDYEPAEPRAWFTVDELNAWADKKLEENPHWAEQDATMQSLKDLKRSVCDAVGAKTFAQPAQQEPVATVVSESGNPNVSMSWWHEPALPVGAKLYTSPPAQRTWVGLTDEEVDEWTPEIHTVIRAIEAKLRSKNEDRN